MKERIKNGEDTLGIEHRELDTVSNEQLGDYFLELARKCALLINILEIFVKPTFVKKR